VVIVCFFGFDLLATYTPELLGGFIIGLAKVVRVIERGEIRDLTDEMFVREYNKYREEALRRAK
jgi:hypothetical protein